MNESTISDPGAPVQRESDAQEWKWRKIVAEFQRPSLIRSIWQIVNSLGVYLVLWCVMYLSLGVSYWLTIPLAIVAGGFLVRVFIIFHDCTHGSFFKARKANDILGFFTGVLVFTPYQQWRWEHSVHHAHSGDLDGRGLGDVWTMTVQEYLAASRWTRLQYRLTRNPFVLFVLGPTFLFLVLQRFPLAKATRKIRRSLHWTNACIFAMAAVLIGIFGLKAYLVIQLTMMVVAATAGVWLFYVQHQFEGVSWERGESWDFTQAALKGSSFYRLPRILQWFSGNIGFHHIHHLSPRIPNYNLESCHRADPLFQSVPAITLFSSMKSFAFRLWDEESRKLVGFRHLRHQGRKSSSNPDPDRREERQKS
ncbi:MAG: fatty acid desaturase [Terrimicrobiaceae bacterium]